MEISKRSLTQFEQHFYSVMLDHYTDRIKVLPTNNVIRERLKNIKEIVSTQSINTTI